LHNFEHIFVLKLNTIFQGSQLLTILDFGLGKTLYDLTKSFRLD